MDDKHLSTLVINLLAGPGSGKSTLAANIFTKLKNQGKECELVTEYPKELVYEERYKTFQNQLYLFAKLHHRIFNLLGKVDIIILDSSLLLTPIYDKTKNSMLEALCLFEFNKCKNFNVFVNRKKVFNPKGRIHTLEQSVSIDSEIKNYLIKKDIPYIKAESSDYGAELVISNLFRC